MNKEVFFAILVCVIAALSITIAVTANFESKAGEEAGQTIHNIQSAYSGDVIVMTVNGTSFSEKEFQIYKSTMSNAQTSYTDEQLLDRLARQQVLFDEAKRRGLTATEAEIDEAINMAKDILQQSDQSENRAFLKSYIKQLGMSEDEYWASIRPAYKKSLSIGNLQDKLRSELAASEGKEYVSMDEWNDYLKNYTDQLINSASIQVFNNKEAS